MPDPNRDFSPRYAREGHSDIELANGEVMISGGENTDSQAQNSVELYSPITQSWRMVAPMQKPRQWHALIRLPNGEILAFGGAQRKGSFYDLERTNERYNPTTNQWSFFAYTSLNRVFGVHTLLQDGRVLVTGGQDATTSKVSNESEIYDPITNTWTTIAPMLEARQSHSSVLLNDGRVLVIGGNPFGGNSKALATCEIFNPATGSWTATGSLQQARSQAKSFLLADGKVITFGGEDEYPVGAVKSVEVFDPATGTWTPAPDMPEALSDPTAALTPSGKIVLAGGSDRVGSQDAVSVYDTILQTWTTLPNLSRHARFNAVSVLPDGKVLALGGSSSWGGDPYPIVDLIDPIAGTVNPKFDRGIARAFHTATLMNDGKVIITGGEITHDWRTLTDAASIYDPTTGITTPTNPLNFARMRHSAVKMLDGRIMIAGGHTDGNGSTRYDALNTVEIFNPATGSWTYAAPMAKGRQNAPLITLPDGRVIVIGGGTKGLSQSDHYFPLNTVEIYDPLTDTWTLGAPMAKDRAGHSATLLPNGKILVVGGKKDTWGPDECHDSVEIYDIASNTWSGGLSLASCRYDHAAHLMSNGKVVIVGGMSVIATAPNKPVALDTVESYDPVANTWSSEAPLPRAIAEPMSALLSGDRILVVGGDGELATSAPSAIYDYNIGQWYPADPLDDARNFATATLLSDGHVLIHGGKNKSFGVLPFSEVF